MISPFDDDLDFESDSEKAQLDTEELGLSGDSGSGASDDKVELDLEDAPFLEDDEDEDEPEEEDGSAPVALEEDGEKRRRGGGFGGLLRNKFVLGGAGGLLLLIIGAVVYLLFFTSPPPPPPVAEKDVIPELPSELQAELNATRAEEKPVEPEFIVSWERFWVEHRDPDGTIRFLICRFAAPTPNEKLSWEAKSKKIVLRDAIFYYLRNKDLTFLSDKKNVDTLKKDILSVVNQYLNNGQFEDILIEEYLVK